ncbi:uncharacterized protein LOC129584508 [Paramacrobiotus metropolitanus]|uniref:uncharacterized protein LOC129584508 n=1 Tax=Paramacrobiotus metropolitanus TaxID=2943436 RepID=UPI002445A931|nr:uncharacterized protein LOC129584508 [Paramacrobiotus metropolitanus]
MMRSVFPVLLKNVWTVCYCSLLVVLMWPMMCTGERARNNDDDIGGKWTPLDWTTGNSFDESPVHQTNALWKIGSLPELYTPPAEVVPAYFQVARRSQINPQSMQAFAPLMQRVRNAIANKRLRPHPRGALPWIYSDKAYLADLSFKPDPTATATDPVVKELVTNKSTKLCYMNPVSCFGRFGRKVTG